MDLGQVLVLFFCPLCNMCTVLWSLADQNPGFTLESLPQIQFSNTQELLPYKELPCELYPTVSLLAFILAGCRWETGLSTARSSLERERAHGQPTPFHPSVHHHQLSSLEALREDFLNISTKEPVYEAKCCLLLYFMLHDSISWQPGVNKASCYLGVSGSHLGFSCYMERVSPGRAGDILGM